MEAEIDGRLPIPLTLVHESLPVLATLLWLVAYAALLQKLRRERSAQGLSLQSLFALLVAETLTFACLCCLFLGAFHSTVSLPLFLCQGVNCFLIVATFSVGTRHASASYQAVDDDFGCLPTNFLSPAASPDEGSKQPRSAAVSVKPGWFSARWQNVFHTHWLSLYVMAGVCAVALEMFRPHRALPLWLSYLEAFSGMVMALALLPQVRMFYKAGRQRIAPSLGRFVVAMLLARLVSLVYWITDWYVHGPKVMPGRGVRLITEGLNILILADLTWSFYRANFKKTTPLPL